MKIGTSASCISSGFIKGFDVPFRSLSRLVGFKLGIRRRPPRNRTELGKYKTIYISGDFTFFVEKLCRAIPLFQKLGRERAKDLNYPGQTVIFSCPRAIF